MTQDKLRRIITACVVGATTLLVFLLGVLVYQWITLGVLNNRISSLAEETTKLEEVIARGEEDAAWYESDIYKDWAAFEKGFVHPEP